MNISIPKFLNQLASTSIKPLINRERTIAYAGVNRVCPAQTDFKSTKDLFLYVKNKCISALNSSTPYEYAVLADIKRNKVLAEYIGDAEKCPLDDLSKMHLDPQNSVIFHGHTESNPISPSDINVLLEYPLNQVVAFDKEGKFSIIAKTIETDMLADTKKFQAYRIENSEESYGVKNTDLPFKSMSIHHVLKKHAPLMGLRYISNFPFTLPPKGKIYY